MKRQLFILAGYPGSGKTTLLTDGLKQGIPFFGEEHDARFQIIRIPPKFPEWSMSRAVAALIECCPDIRLLDEAPGRRRNSFFRGLASLPATLLQ